MIRALRLAAVIAAASSPALAQAQQGWAKVGDTLACTSKDPGKRLFVVIGAIEPFGANDTVANVTLSNEQAGAAFAGLAHVPIQLKALEAACPAKAPAARALAADFEREHQQWLAGVRTENAGMFTMSIDQIDDIFRDSIAQAQSQAQPEAGKASQ